MHTLVLAFSPRRFAPLLTLAICVLTGAFLPAPAHALTEAQQDAAISQLQSAVASLQQTVNAQQDTINKQASKITQLSGAVSGLQNKLKYVSVQGTDFTFTGCNVHIVNGLGATNGEPNAPYDTTSPVVNGLGNLVIGYNESRANDPNNPTTDTRTGSHCLILGDESNYSSYGGLVAGDANEISAPFASISGGFRGFASGNDASISGGYANTASGFTASVSGGHDNLASGAVASVSGGYQNTASYYFASISGGYGNTASGNSSAVSGGSGITESATNGWAAGAYHSP